MAERSARSLDTLEATQAAGAALGQLMQAGDVVLLQGDLGAGKTALVTGLVSAIGDPVLATSPTFSLVHEHRGGRIPVWHCDLYRIDSEAALRELGLDELIDDGGGAVLIEWSERLARKPPNYLLVSLQGAGESPRLVEWFGVGPRGEALAQTWDPIAGAVTSTDKSK